jgi:hypothetical protein
MPLLSTPTKGKVGVKAAKTGAKNPKLLGLGARAVRTAGTLGGKAGKPVAKRRARRSGRQLGETARTVGETARTVGETLAVYGPQAAYVFGLVDRPKPKRTAPRVAVGILLGAGAMYFLEPDHGRERRQKVAELVS